MSRNSVYDGKILGATRVEEKEEFKDVVSVFPDDDDDSDEEVERRLYSVPEFRFDFQNACERIELACDILLARTERASSSASSMDDCDFVIFA